MNIIPKLIMAGVARNRGSRWRLRLRPTTTTAAPLLFARPLLARPILGSRLLWPDGVCRLALLLGWMGVPGYGYYGPGPGFSVAFGGGGYWYHGHHYYHGYHGYHHGYHHHH